MIQWERTEGILSSTGTYYGSMRDIGVYALAAQMNELASRGVTHAAAEIQITIPADMDKSRLNSIRNHIKRAKEMLLKDAFIIEDLQMDGRVNRALRVPAVTVTVLGQAKERERFARATMTARAGQDILLVGWAGLEGMLRIIG